MPLNEPPAQGRLRRLESAGGVPRVAAQRPSARLLSALTLSLLVTPACKDRAPAFDPKYPLDMVTLATPADGSRDTASEQRARPAAAAFAGDDGQWTSALKDFAGTRYTGLNEINTTNVADLRLAWSFDFGLARGQEATPLVVGTTMYVVTSFPNRLYAFDLTQPGASVKWIYDPRPERAAQGVACCDHVNRGAAFADGRVIFGTLDGHAVAVDAASGAEVWRTKLGDFQKGESMTMAPLVVRGRVFFGNSGGEFGVRGWLKALDVATGAVSWTAYSTGPDADVLIGEAFRPFYEKDRGTDLGVASWPAEHWKIGGGTVWGWLTYDPEQDLLYYGTANAAPWNPESRPGDNKWAATLFARRPDTGDAVWAYQWDPHNVYNWDGVNESTLVDLPHDGRMRQALVRAEQNGFVYTMDRLTGEVLDATRYAHTTAVKDVDTKSGHPVRDLEHVPGYEKTAHGICPAVAGAKNREPTAFSPRTGYLYIPANNLCMDIRGTESNHIAGTPYLGAEVKMYGGPGGFRGEIIAWDPVQRKQAWSVKEKFVTWSGALATGGDLVFYGTMDRYLKALDARTGALLWRFEAPTGIIAPPISYRGPDGRQYVAVLSGPGGWAGSVVSAQLDPRDQTGARGFVNAMADLPAHTGRGGHLHVFRLP